MEPRTRPRRAAQRAAPPARRTVTISGFLGRLVITADRAGRTKVLRPVRHARIRRRVVAAAVLLAACAPWLAADSRTKAHVTMLASDALEGRLTASSGE